MPPKTKFVRDLGASKDKPSFLSVFKLWFWTALIVALTLVILGIFGYLLGKFPPKEPKAFPMIEKNKQEMNIQVPDGQIKETNGRVRMEK